MAATSEVDSVLKQFTQDNPAIAGYVVLNADGIPVKFHEDISNERAVLYASLFSDFLASCRKSLRELLAGVDAEMSHVRLRTSVGTELIAMSVHDFTLVAVQNCSGRKWEDILAAED